MKSQIKSSTLYVGNLPVDATRTEVEEVFGEAGPIKKCFILKAKNDSSSYAFVTYALPEDTDTAAEELKDATIRGNQLKVSISNRKQKLKHGKDESEQKISEKPTPTKKLSSKKRKSESGVAVEVTPQNTSPGKKKGHAPLNAGQNAAPSKKGRLIVRNLSFKVTEESFRKHFAAVGPVTEVKLLKKPNGLLVGCGFVQYKHEMHAEAAIKKYNTKPFLGRPIVVDWAVDKARYEAAQKPTQTANKGTKRPLDDDEEEVEDDGEEDEGDDSDGDDSTSDISPKESTSNRLGPNEADSEDDDEEENTDDEEGESENTSNDEGEDETDTENESSGGEDDEVDSEEEDANSPNSKTEPSKIPGKQKQERKSDLSEGSTLFIKNMSFDTDQAALKELFSRYGRVKYALLCIDPLTEHPRGTAFVQFKGADEAAAALAAAAEPQNAALFTLDDRRIEVLPAVNKDQLRRKDLLEKEQSAAGKDKRNLYLAREGLVREGSQAAEGVSRADLNKRIGLEKWKTKMLKNLNMFVSPVRLCVHNLPLEWDDARLRKLFQQHATPGAQVTEARVMRDRRDVTSHPRGQSKEYGFVTFTQHEASLAALRNINNNPEIFTANRRPIVEFAVENRAALDARRRREEKSKQMNEAKPGGGGGGGGTGGRRARPAKGAAATAPAAASAPRTQPARPAHAGLAADPANKRLPKLKVRTGAQESAKAITRKMLKAGKKGRRERAGQKKDVVQDWEPPAADAKKKNSRREKKKALKVRQKERPEDVRFTSLVDKYRQKLAAPPAASVRWFQ